MSRRAVRAFERLDEAGGTVALDQQHPSDPGLPSAAHFFAARDRSIRQPLHPADVEAIVGELEAHGLVARGEIEEPRRKANLRGEPITVTVTRPVVAIPESLRGVKILTRQRD